MDKVKTEIIFNNNLKFLSKVNPAIHKNFITNQKFYESKVKFEYSNKDFTHVSFLTQEGRFRALHSKINPYKEAKRFIAHCEVNATHNILLFGLGLGYHVFELLSLKEKPGWILIVENDLKTFWAFCHLHDIKFLYQTHGLFFLAVPHPNDLFSFFQPHSFNILANGIKMIRHQASFSTMKNEYEQLELKVDGFSSWAKANVMTQVHAANTFSKNILQNLSRQIESIPLKTFKNQFENVPAIIVSGGPSLPKNGHLLNIVKGKGLIIAVDTALRFLKKISVEPDFIISTDFTKNALDYFTDIKNNNSILIVDSEVNSEIVKNYTGKLSFVDIEGKAMTEWLRKCIGDFGILPKGISVSHTAFSIAKYMGARPIIFIGQDLAFTQGRTHFKGASHGVHISADDSYPTVKGLFGEIKTSNSLKVFRDHFENLFSSEKDIEVIDATEGGAIIHGTKIMTFREVILKYFSKLPSISAKIIALSEPDRIKKISFKQVRRYLNDTLSKISPVITMSRDTIHHIDKMIENVKSKDTEKFEKHYHEFKKISAKLLMNNDILNLMRDNMMEAYVLKAKKFNTKFKTTNEFMHSTETPSCLFAEKSFYYHLEKAAISIYDQIKASPFIKKSE